MMRNILTAAIILFTFSMSAEDQSLFQIKSDLDLKGFSQKDVTLRIVEKNGVNAFEVTGGGTDEDWPGFTIKAPENKWDLAKYEKICADIENLDNETLRVALRVDNPDSSNNKNRISGGCFVEPGGKSTIEVFLTRRQPGAPDLIGMKEFPQGMAAEGYIRPEEVSQIVFFMHRPIKQQKFLVSNIRAAGTYTKAPYEDMKADKFFPFIDEFGQFMHKDWPGKVKSAEDMKARKIEEEKDFEKYPGPSGWNKYGGWQDGPTLKATGHFYTAKHGGKWWLVDPDGRLFFSHGITCVNSGSATPLSDRENYFKSIPDKDGKHKDLFFTQKAVKHGYYKDKTPLCFNFGKYNLSLKYGDKWEELFGPLACKRLRSWGISTLGLWSDEDIAKLHTTPYVTWVHYWPKNLKGKTNYWKKFIDVFAPETWESLKARAANFLKDSANDPWCIGVFVDNELPWESSTTVAVTTIISPADQKAKQVFVEDLKAKYKDIEALNKVWGAKFASWDALLKNDKEPDVEKARADLEAFSEKTAETYFKNVREIVKAVAPNKLYLGCRFNGDFLYAAKIAAKYCDVVSYNLYRDSVADFKVAGGMDMPAIIGEWHFGALDRGPFAGGLRTVKNQEERAKIYKSYVAGALKNPNLIGCHWFQYNDEATSGRPLEGENYQIGFIDIADTPYAETVAAAREVGYEMYKTRNGEAGK
ncbi:MAG: hypothetical protein A2X48_01065 [Lentisphaerae bacterium GWF2_49_21]|nr:MAG: hypothetical protein A2X48_01065 [Lentisphaerae bacterium GWF2_49_21]